MRENSATVPVNPHPALSHRCPFCQADPGTPCRTHRGRGHELEHPHSRRVTLAAVTRPADEQPEATRVNALCCACGTVRTVSSDHRRPNDPEHASSERGKAEGWRKTQSLKCDTCGNSTRHALLQPAAAPHRDWEEDRQRVILGGRDGAKYPLVGEHLKQMRDEYFAQFPRNPKLSHRFWTGEADELREQGETHMQALCGATAPIPRSFTKSSRDPGALHEPDRIDWDTEFEDPETGMWWVDMSCVDCLRVSNELERENRRVRAQELINWYFMQLARVDRLSYAEIEALIEFLEPAANATFTRWQQNQTGDA